MTKGLDDRELEGLSDEERAALDEEEVGTLSDAERAAKAAELPDDGDKGDASKDPDDPGAKPDADADADAAAAAATATDQSPDEGAATDDETDADEPVPMRLEPPAVDDADEKIAQLLDQRKAIRAAYREGELTAEEKDDQEDAINDQIADLRAAKQNAAFVENYNRQASQREHADTVVRVKAEIRERDGIDYDQNPLLWQRWDLKVRELARDPANAQRTSRWFLEEAHKAVKSEIEAAAKSLGFKREGDNPEDKLRDAVRGRKPSLPGQGTARSLATLPIASQDTGRADGEFAHLENLDGMDLEMEVARMTPEQQERWSRL